MTVSHDERALARQLAQVRKVRRKEAKQARPKNLKADRGRVRDTAHLAYVRRLPCVATYVETGRLVYGCQAAHLRLNSAAHGKTEGGQRKPSDQWVAPLSAEQHRIQGDVKGERQFWGDLGVDPFDLCQRLYAVSGDIEAGETIIKQARRMGPETPHDH